jgi:ATP-dependent protease ClpP protease subunit
MAYAMRDLPPELSQRLQGAKGRLAPWAAIEALTFHITELHRAVKDLQGRNPQGGESEPTPAPAPASAKATRGPLRLSLLNLISSATVAPIIREIERNKDREIHLTISSLGGVVDAARDLCDAMAKHGRCDTMALVSCVSAATLIFAAGRHRTAIKGCTFSFHRPSIEGRPWLTEREEGVVDATEMTMAKFLAQRTGQSARRFSSMMRSTEPVTIGNARAVEVGLVHGVRRPARAKR